MTVRYFLHNKIGNNGLINDRRGDKLNNEEVTCISCSIDHRVSWLF